MNFIKIIYIAGFLALTIGATPALAGTIDFTGEAVISIGVAPASTYTVLGNSYNVAEIGNYLDYPHGTKANVAYVEGYGSAALSEVNMSAANIYSPRIFQTQGQLHADVNGFVSHYNENRMDCYIYVDGGTYDFTITVDSWKRSLSWNQTGGGYPLTEAGWYSNLYVKLVQEGTILQEANLVLISEVYTTFSPAVHTLTTEGSSNDSLSFSHVELKEGRYTLYLADYMTQYGVNPLPTVPVPGSLLLLGSGLTVLAAWRHRLLK
jgi:hypothetical protein